MDVNAKRGYRGVLGIINNSERVLVCVFLSVLSVVLILQVFMRYVLREPLAWPEEFSRYLLIWTAFVGSSQAIKDRRVVSIDVLPQTFGGAAERLFYYLMNLGFLLFCGIAIYFSIDFISHVMRSKQVSPAMGIPMWIVYLAAPVGLGMAAMRTVEAIIAGPGPASRRSEKEES